MQITPSAKAVLEKRYLMRDAEGRPIETVEDMFRRVADAVAQADAAYGGNVSRSAEEFYQMMTQLEFLPNSPTLMNAGRPLGQLSACFVLPVADSMEEIFDAIKNAARLAYMAEAMKYALIVVSSAPLLIAYPFVQKYFAQGAMIGSLKE